MRRSPDLPPLPFALHLAVARRMSACVVRSVVIAVAACTALGIFVMLPVGGHPAPMNHDTFRDVCRALLLGGAAIGTVRAIEIGRRFQRTRRLPS